jgi:hypothetical protein
VPPPVQEQERLVPMRQEPPQVQRLQRVQGQVPLRVPPLELVGLAVAHR